MMNISELRHSLEELLSKHNKKKAVLLEFEKLSNYADKVKYLENLLIEYELLPIKELPSKIEKNNVISKELCQKGYTNFKLKTTLKLYKALEFYNESIAYAECNTENLSLCYENRADAYFELNMYDMCLENIKLAKENRSPDSSIKKLTYRELICNNEIQLQNKNDKIVYIPELSYPPHEKIPFIANCLELCEDEEYGRYIKTNIDLEPGKIIAIEKPFSTILDPSKRYICCANCLSENSLNLIPCLNCTSAMFCNEKCRTEAYNNFHKYECPIISYLFKIFDLVSLNALRLSLKAMLTFKSTQALLAFTESTNQNDVNTFPLNYNEDSEEKNYYPIYKLATNEGKRSISNLFNCALIAAALNNYLYNFTPFKEHLKSTDKQNMFLQLLYKHLMTVATNYFSIHFIDVRGEQEKGAYHNAECASSIRIYGSGTYAFSSMLNHSCAPNIVRNTFKTNVVLYVIKLIKSGEQLFINYGHHHCIEPKDIRQKELSTHFHFQCQCIACKNDYPLVNDLVENKTEVMSYPEMIGKFKKEQALLCIEIYIDYLKKHNYIYPSKAVCNIQSRLNTSYSIALDKTTFRLQLLVNSNNK